MFKDEIGARMKQYEHQVTGWKIDRMLPVYARIDGRAFSSLTKRMNSPFDYDMIWLMQQVTFGLVNETRAKIGYTQSDEINLLWHWNGEDEEAWFGGKIYKLTSILASLTTSLFHKNLMAAPDPLSYQIEDIQDMLPQFDCRVMNLPSEIEAANMFVWRNLDAQRNAVQKYAQSIFSHRELQGKNVRDILNMIEARNLNYNEVAVSARHGSWARHDGVYICPVDFRKMKNRTDFLFRGHVPIYRDDNDA